MDEVPNNMATKGFAAGEAARSIRVPLVETIGEPSTGYPKAFDIEDGTTEGNIKLVRCYFQIGSDFFLASDTEEITPAAGNLCAVINTNTGTVIAAMDATYSLSTPELFPVRLFVLSSTGSVVCDCRGSQVVIYG